MPHRGSGSGPEPVAWLESEGHATAGAIKILMAYDATWYHGVILARLLLRVMSGFVIL